MSKTSGWSLMLVLLSGFGCGSGARARPVRTLEPARLNLVPYGRVGLTIFAVENAKGKLHEFATQRFAEEVLRAQQGIELQELGRADSAAAAQSLAAARDVPIVFLGHLKVSNVKPSGSLAGFTLPFVEATVSAELSVQLISTKSGGTLWRSSAAATEKVGQLAMVGGQPDFAARDPNAAYGQLVNRLVAAVTRDLWPTWREQ